VRPRVDDGGATVAGTPRTDRDYRDRCLLVGDPELEIVVLEELLIDDGYRVVVDAASDFLTMLALPRLREHTRVQRLWQRQARVADRISPTRHVFRGGDRRVEQLAYPQLLHSFREGGVDAPSVETKLVNLLGVSAELRRPLHAHEVADDEPSVCVFEPKTSTVMIFIGGRAVIEAGHGLGDLVHLLPRLHVLR